MMGLLLIVKTLLLLTIFVCSSQASPAATSPAPALSYWNRLFPGVALPPALRLNLSPLTKADVAAFTQQIRANGWHSLHSSAFCDSAGIMCAEKAAIHFDACCKTYRRRRRLLRFTVLGCNLRFPSASGRTGEFFREAQVLSAGKQVPVFGGSQDDPLILHRAFLPRDLAELIPFDSKQLPQILNDLNIAPTSDMATGIVTSLQMCEQPDREGFHDRACASSLETMADFIFSHLGSRVKVLSFAEDTSAIFGNAVKVIDASLVSSSSAKHVSCHTLVYPYQVYYCHDLVQTNVYSVSLQARDGTVITNVGASCHEDTSGYIKSHPAFVALQFKPGDGEVCHWVLSNTLIFVHA